MYIAGFVAHVGLYHKLKFGLSGHGGDEASVLENVGIPSIVVWILGEAVLYCSDAILDGMGEVHFAVCIHILRRHREACKRLVVEKVEDSTIKDTKKGSRVSSFGQLFLRMQVPAMNQHRFDKPAAMFVSNWFLIAFCTYRGIDIVLTW